MTYRVINKEQLIEANNIARHLNWPRHFKSDDFSDDGSDLDELRDIMEGN